VAIIRGRVIAVRHKGDDFCVFTVALDEAQPSVEEKVVTVAGPLFGLLQVTVGVTVAFSGQWGAHPKFGKQFIPHTWHPYARTPRDIERFLSECVSDFTDPVVVDKLVQTYGTEVFAVLSERPAEVQALFSPDDPARDRLDRAIMAWARARSLADLSVFLTEFQVDANTIRAVYATFDSNAIRVITENPYRLVSVNGFGFALADKLAFKQGFGRDAPERIEGAVLYLLRQEAQNGHLYIRRGDLPALVDDLMQREFMEAFDVPDLSRALLAAVDRLVERKDAYLDKSAGVYLPVHWKHERESAAMLAKFITASKLDVDLAAFVAEYERVNPIVLSPAQKDGIQKLIENRVLVLTGLPGTGKTTLVRAFVRLFREKKLTHTLMAPTGIAAKRLAGVTGTEAYTIHRAFGYDGDGWQYHGANKFQTDAVIVDEMSMVDQELFFRVLDALHPDTILVLVGDDAQLPSVGPGNVLRELLASEHVPNVRLTQIFRQQHTSEIVVASHTINRGETLSLEKRPPESEFQFVHLTDEEQISELIVKMALKLKARDANFQVLTPKYDGYVGVNNLNDRLREALNPSTGQPEWKAGYFHSRVGDRLMVIKNNYKLGIYNGDMGKLVEIQRENLMVRIHGIGPGAVDTLVAIPKADAPELLRLAYAITVHKSQGSEFDNVLLPIVKGHGRMLQRNLFYTAVTRAKKKCWVLGDPFSVYKAIGNDKVVLRNTAFGRAVSEAVVSLSGVREGHDHPREEARRPAVEPD